MPRFFTISVKIYTLTPIKYRNITLTSNQFSFAPLSTTYDFQMFFCGTGSINNDTRTGDLIMFVDTLLFCIQFYDTSKLNDNNL